MARIHPGPRKGRSGVSGESPPGQWDGRLRVWIDVGGRPALGPGKVRLLEAIAATKSLSAAAKQLKMSYRLAWQHLRSLEERTGLAVISPQRGGRSGGGTELTRDGLGLLEAYHNFHREVEEQMQSACRRYFARWASPHDPRRQVPAGPATEPSNSSPSTLSPPDDGHAEETQR